MRTPLIFAMMRYLKVFGLRDWISQHRPEAEMTSRSRRSVGIIELLCVIILILHYNGFGTFLRVVLFYVSGDGDECTYISYNQHFLRLMDLKRILWNIRCKDHVAVAV